ncbi:MAG TPA: hypothetical protein VMT62_15600 [Syntrophorhabdaceae bacterium]|nr:hypothetical protein [Syntrophorhabdaceae bacterium]
MMDTNNVQLSPLDQPGLIHYASVEINGALITIEDYAIDHRQYPIRKYLAKYVRLVPKEDLASEIVIRLFDRIPHYVQNKKVAAACYPPEQMNNGNLRTLIEIYLYECLGDMPKIAAEHRIVGVLRNKIFFFLFGKVFLAASLFHEVGHLRQSHLWLEGPESNDKDEADAVKYENILLEMAFPFSQHHYSLVNAIYKWLYRVRIRKFNIERTDRP